MSTTTLVVPVEEEKLKLLQRDIVLYITVDGVAYVSLGESHNEESSLMDTNTGNDDNQEASKSREPTMPQVRHQEGRGEAGMAIPTTIPFPTTSFLPCGKVSDDSAYKEEKPVMVVPLRLAPPTSSSTSSLAMPTEMFSNLMARASERSVEPQTTTPPTIQPSRIRKGHDVASSVLFDNRWHKYSWVPENWFVEERTRVDGRVDKFYYPPTGQTFRSKVTALAFMKEQGVEVDESLLKKRKHRTADSSNVANTSGGTVANEEPNNNKN